jgi:nicotinate phosphoribosyltransferase
MEFLTRSILDTDLYKITMGQAVAMQYGDIDVEYEFTDRAKQHFSEGFCDELKKQIKAMEKLRLTDAEYEWLKTNPTLGFLKRPFIDFFARLSIRQQ